MTTFGATLKREREAQGISLQEISDKTRIGVRLLKALEDEQMAQLPGGIFNKSFVRQYARCLGLDEDQIVSEYVRTVGAAPEPPPASSGSTILEMPSFSEGSDSRDSGYPGLILMAVLVGIAAVAILYGVRQFTERRAARAAAAQSESRSVASAPAPPAAPETGNALDTSPGNAPADAVSSVPGNPLAGSATDMAAAQPPATGQSRTGESGVSNSQPPAAPATPLSTAPIQKTASAPAPANPAAKPIGESPAANADALLLQIETRKDCWISIDADGQLQWQGTLPAERSRSAQAHDSFRLRVGDAGAVTLLLNGKPLPSLGHSGEVKTVIISAKGLAPAEP